MKFTSTLITLALGISLGNAVALPTEDVLVVRDDEALPFELEGVEAFDVEGDEEDELATRAVRPIYHFNNFPSKGGKCAKRQYSGGNVKDVGTDAGKLADRGKQIGTGKYPHQYNNRENIKFSAKCKGKTLQEFPILESHKVYIGTEATPGPDRVVVTVSKRDKKGNVDVTYCGLMTHEGAKNKNGFVACT